MRVSQGGSKRVYSRSSSGHGPLPRSAPRRALRPEHVSPPWRDRRIPALPSAACMSWSGLAQPGPPTSPTDLVRRPYLSALSRTFSRPPLWKQCSRRAGSKFISFRPVHVRVQGDPRQLGRGPKGSAPCTPHKRALGPGGAASVTCSSRSRSNFRQLQRSPTRASGSAMSTSTNVGPPLPSLPPTGSNPTHSRVSRPGYIRTLHFGPVPGVGPS